MNGVHHGGQVVVIHELALIPTLLEQFKQARHVCIRNGEAQRIQAHFHGMPPGMLGQGQFRSSPANFLRIHDFISAPVFQNAVLMNADQFINNDGNEINTYELVKVKLYFANAAGDKLIASYREKHYSTNTPLERFVVEELIAGPSGQIEGLYPVINPETKIVNILTKDGICYVNLDSNFLTVINNVSTEVAVYSIVNSLVELDNINKVQILVNGEVPPTFSNSTFERNLDYVTTLEQ